MTWGAKAWGSTSTHYLMLLAPAWPVADLLWHWPPQQVSVSHSGCARHLLRPSIQVRMRNGEQALHSLMCVPLGHTRAGALDTGNHGEKQVRFWVFDIRRCVLGLSPHSRETLDLASLCGVSKSLNCLLWISPSALGSIHLSSNIHTGIYSAPFGNTSNKSVKGWLWFHSPRAKCSCVSTLQILSGIA